MFLKYTQYAQDQPPRQYLTVHHKRHFEEKPLVREVFLGEVLQQRNYPAGIYLFKANNRNTRTMCEICSKLTIKTPERRQGANVLEMSTQSECNLN